MMATYDPETKKTYWSLVVDDQGWSVGLPGHWTIAQISRYLNEVMDWSGMQPRTCKVCLKLHYGQGGCE